MRSFLIKCTFVLVALALVSVPLSAQKGKGGGGGGRRWRFDWLCLGCDADCERYYSIDRHQRGSV